MKYTSIFIENEGKYLHHSKLDGQIYFVSQIGHAEKFDSNKSAISFLENQRKKQTYTGPYKIVKLNY